MYRTVIRIFFIQGLFILSSCTAKTVLSQNKKPSLYHKLACLLPPTSAYARQLSPEELEQLDAATQQLFFEEQEKYKTLINAIIADATPIEKLKKLLVVIVASYLIYAYPLSRLDILNPYIPQIVRPISKLQQDFIIGLIYYTLYYRYYVTEKRMSIPLAASCALTCSSIMLHGYPYLSPIRGLIMYKLLFDCFLLTTEDKLKRFVECDEQEWQEIKKQIPTALFNEFGELHKNTMKYNALLLSDKEIYLFAKKLQFGALPQKSLKKQRFFDKYIKFITLLFAPLFRLSEHE